MDFSEKLSAARKAKGLSQEELAAKMEVSRQAVSKWESGSAFPESANILKLCSVLEVSPNEFFGYEEKSAVPDEKPQKSINAKAVIIIAAVILFVVYLIWVDENRGYSSVKDLRFPITSYEHCLVPEKCTENCIAVEITFTPGIKKSHATYSISVFSDHFGGGSTVDNTPAVKNDDGTVTAVILVPREGESQIVAFVYEGNRTGTNLFCWIDNVTEDSYELKTLSDISAEKAAS